MHRPRLLRVSKGFICVYESFALSFFILSLSRSTYMCIYICAVGSRTEPHLALCWVNNWATVSCYLENHLLSAGRMRFLKKKQSFKKTFLKHNSWVNNWATCASKNGPTCGPATDPTFWTQKPKTVAKIGPNPYFMVFLKKHIQTSENIKAQIP